ncbi:hypothetical protein [Maritimibacter sp. UBA3975]|uniref:hypothetical protein n=1 Tax=Maritimibacter sp. UBA3975 TaxID=1946833 RepID=UPI000C0B91DA|nr:hypothetical protein [Maritimibacter sp. UBA3975]MAM63457.1 hypothetical protein [Maritimibacter sp.]|tara:strand:+ start:24060 stop:24980 length:921 start_codon:yes stop_codon:yes gene_type:complete
MTEARVLRIYLDDVMFDMAKRGEFGFVARVTKAFEEVGFRVELRRNSLAERLKSGARQGYSLFHMDDPFHPKSLTIRKSYFFPFWRIEATAKRWEFNVARKPFDPGEIDSDVAMEWYGNWRKWLFKSGPSHAQKTGVVYVPLQGKLLEHRSFQSMSPIDMIREVQARAGDRHILLGLHPGEVYSDEEMATLDGLQSSDSRIAVEVGGMEDALRICDFVITENSSAALSGLFFGKPAVLFAECDFHHQMPRVSELGVDEAWRQLDVREPDYAEYLYWFVALNSIKADEEGIAESRILETCASYGWQV